MTNTEAGVYLQFFDEGESMREELPPLGPFELLIVRHNQIIGEREHVEHDTEDIVGVGAWLEAELELRRALGDEPGGARRSQMRIRAPRGDIIVRFYGFTGDEPPEVPELGPFHLLIVGKRQVRADGKVLAMRATDIAPWTLTDEVPPEVAGVNKSDFLVFPLSARERGLRRAPAAAGPAAAAAPIEPPLPAPAASPVERRPLQPEIYVARPILAADDTPEPAGRDRVRRAPPRERLPQERDPADAEDGEDRSLATRLLGLLWSGRLVVVAALLVALALSAYGYLQPKAVKETSSALSFALVGHNVESAEWTYTVNSVERPPRLGAVAPAAGGFLIVTVTVAKKTSDAAALVTTDFLLTDPNGGQSFAFSPSNDVYANSAGLAWSSRYATNTPTRNTLVFDVNPAARNLVLLIRPANVEVRLPDP